MSFEQFKIKTYDLWDLFLHEQQFPYLGRCYAWARREDAQKVTDMSPRETSELFEKVIPAWNTAIEKLFQHDWPNVSCLGNTSPHLHWHLIRRYHSPRVFRNISFVDPNPTGNYAPYPKQELDVEILQEIKGMIGKELSVFV